MSKNVKVSELVKETPEKRVVDRGNGQSKGSDAGACVPRTARRPVWLNESEQGRG